MKIEIQEFGPTETRLYFVEPTGEVHWRIDVHDTGHRSMVYTVSHDGWIVAELETGCRAYWLRKPNAAIPDEVLSHVPGVREATERALPSWVH
jgi:hypothetical protein